MNCRITTILLMALCGSLCSAQTMYNLDKTEQQVGYKYFYGTGYEKAPSTGDPNYVSGISHAVGDDMIYLRDRSRWNGDQGYAHELDNELRMVFRGSGIEFNYIQWDQTDLLHWALNEDAAGSFTLTGPIEIKTFEVAPQGTLDPNRLHLLRLWIEDTDNEGSWSKTAPIDTIQIYDEVAVSRSEDGDQGWQTTGTWETVSEADFPASDGTLLASTTPGDTLTFTFTGTAVAIIGGGHFETTGLYNWRIDDGSEHSGTIDQSLDGTWEFAYRWPDVVVNDLHPGEHTVTITVGGEGQYGGTGVYVDAFDYIPYTGPHVNSVRGGWHLYD